MSRRKFASTTERFFSRRQALKAGALGLGSLSMADYLRAAEAGTTVNASAQGAIFIFLNGGPPHLDTFDLKPDAPEEIRGEFKPIATNVPGISICEHLPRLAQVTDKFALLRSVSHSLAAHELGTKYVITGNRPIPSLEYPGFGNVVAKELSCAAELPPFVAIPESPMKAGYIGVEHSSFNTVVAPVGPSFRVRGISIDGSLTLSDMVRRQTLLEELDDTFRAADAHSDLLAGLDKFRQRAHAILRSEKAREAFDLGREKPEVAERFGMHAFGQSCLLAARLIEAGVRFVTINSTGWDTHQNNFKQLRGGTVTEKFGRREVDRGKLPELDDGLSALLSRLDSNGLLASTLITVMGEFSRTPNINKTAGRDHWSRAMSVLMAGGGVRGGQVIGETDEKGMGPTSDPIAPDDIAATLYHTLGIEPTTEYYTDSGRPVQLARDGHVIKALF